MKNREILKLRTMAEGDELHTTCNVHDAAGEDAVYSAVVQQAALLNTVLERTGSTQRVTMLTVAGQTLLKSAETSVKLRS